MSPNWLLQKEHVDALCKRASLTWETYLPFEMMGDDVHFAHLPRNADEHALGQLKLDYTNLVIPPKVIAFPQLEMLFQFQGGRINQTVRPRTKRLLFGLRACDVKGLSFLKAFFKRNFEDVYYLNRIEDACLIVVGCTQPQENCFCTSTQTGPFLKTGFDLQLIDIGKSYVIEVGSQKGEEFLSQHAEFFIPAQEMDIRDKDNTKCGAEEAVKLRLDFDEAIKKFCQDKVGQTLFETIAERCVYCGGCLYVCPTCSCFNVFDDGSHDDGYRYRNWDGCVFAGYTREASKHNPRAEKWLRTVRRYEHKLKYDYLSTGMSGCVGCGRCLSSCPVNIGMSQVIDEVSIQC